MGFLKLYYEKTGVKFEETIFNTFYALISSGLAFLTLRKID